MTTEKLLSVYIVDDDMLVGSAISIWLSSSGYNPITFESADLFLAALPTLPPGCVLLDLQMPGIDGLGVLERARASLKSHPVIMLTGHGYVDLAVSAMKLGATDFIEKPCHLPLLLKALKLAFETLEGQPLPEAVQDDVVSAVRTLSPRETDVLHGLMDGLSNKELARRLDLSPRTIEMHRANMMKRLGARSLSDALRIGLMARPLAL